MEDWELRIPPRARREGPLRLGAVPCLYAEPLVYGLRHRANLTLDRAMPATLAADFEAGGLAAALLPVIEAVRHPRARLVPGLGVYALQSGGEQLLCRVPPRAVKTLSAEAADDTFSVAQLVLAEFCTGSLPAVVAPLEADAVVVSGNAVLEAYETFSLRYDLGALWTEHTGLPWVMAVWTIGDGVPTANLRAMLALSAQEGIDHIDEIAEEAPATYRIPSELAKDYLANRVGYRLGGAEAESLRRLVTLGVKHGLCAPETAVRFC